MLTAIDRVIETLRCSPGVDNVELARQAKVELKEAMLICRYLEMLNEQRRMPGEDGKTVVIMLDI